MLILYASKDLIVVFGSVKDNKGNLIKFLTVQRMCVSNPILLLVMFTPPVDCGIHKGIKINFTELFLFLPI